MKIGHRTLGLTFLVAAVHAVLIGWVLGFESRSHIISPPNVISVEFAETNILPETPPSPDVPSEAKTERKAAEPAPEAPRQRTVDSETLPILSQPAISAAEADLVVNPERIDDAPDAPVVLDRETLALALQNMSCQRMNSDRLARDGACPERDPFTIAEASIARQQAPLPAPNLVGDFGPKSAIEAFMSQKDRAPFLMPGMSADLFTEGVGAAAYNAQRIRNGQAPIWDRDLERAFERQD